MKYTEEKLNSLDKETLIQLFLQIASQNGHLCHIRRPPCDLNGGQPRTH